MTTRNELILVDVDGVLLDWQNAFTLWMIRQGHHENPKHVASYQLGERYGLEDKHIDDLIKQFNCSAAVGFCQPFRDAVEYVRKLRTDHKFRFVAITSFGGDKYSRLLRNRNLTDHFGWVFDQINILDLDESKDTYLQHYEGTNAWWIEDKPSNAEAGLKFGLRPILLEHPYTHVVELSDDIVVVPDWKSIYDIITNEPAVPKRVLAHAEH